MSSNGIQGILNRNIIRIISKEKLVEGYCNRGLLFILSRCVFNNNNLLWRHLIG